MMMWPLIKHCFLFATHAAPSNLEPHHTPKSPPYHPVADASGYNSCTAPSVAKDSLFPTQDHLGEPQLPCQASQLFHRSYPALGLLQRFAATLHTCCQPV